MEPTAAAAAISSDQVKAHAAAAGFDLCGIAPASDFPELHYLREWLERGYHGEMHYLARNADRRADVRAVLSEARAVIMLGTVYNTDRPYSTEVEDPSAAAIARYAWGDDYHDVIGRRMSDLLAALERATGPFQAKAYVDTGPVQERVYAKYAGLGWIGKNTCLINQHLGSWLFLSAIICDLPLAADAPATDHCGRCTLCIDACPTGAIVAPYQLDARRCISYLTIENKGEVPEAQRPAIGRHAYGCDVCQDVCPWNGKAAISLAAPWQPRGALDGVGLLDLWRMRDDELRSALKGSAMKRAGVRRLRRNLAVAIGNMEDGSAADVLEGSCEDSARDPLVQQHVTWAVEKLRGEA
jgi:epoxyqueuosine reductase